MKKIYIVAAVAAIVAGALLYFYLGQLEKDSEVEIIYEPVLVAAQDIPAYSEITEELVTVAQVPQGTRHAKAASSVQQVLGLMTKNVIFAGEQMIPEKLTATGEQATTLSYAIPEGMRAITIAVSDISGVGGQIRKGDYVDVIAYAAVKDVLDDYEDKEIPAKDGMTEEQIAADKLDNYYLANAYTTILCAQDVQVAMVGRDMTGTGSESVSSSYEFITLFVTPQEAMNIAEMEHGGVLTVLLRGTGDHAENKQPPINAYDVLRGS